MLVELKVHDGVLLAQDTVETYTQSFSTYVDLGKEIKERVSFCDLKLVVHGNSIDVHKVVLAARSKYFETMLTGNFRETQQDSIDLSHAIGSAKALACIIDFFYTGKITISLAEVEDILAAAHLFLLPDVKDFCTEFLFKNLCPNNCLRNLALADVYSMKNLYNICLDMVTCRFQDYLQYSEHILEIPGQFFEKLIKDGAFKFMKPYEVRTMLLRWLENGADIRHVECIGILRCMKEEQLLDSPLSDLIDENTETVPIEFLHAELGKFPDPDSPFTCSVHKAVVGWSMEKKPNSSSNAPVNLKNQTHELKIQIYFPEVGRWYKHYQECCLSTETSHLESLLGFFNDGLVFQGYPDQLMFFDFQKTEKQWTTLSSPSRSSNSSLHFHNGMIFHLRLDVTQLTVDLTVATLDSLTMTWKEECQGIVSTVNQNDVKPCVHAYSTSDALYVLVATNKNMKFVKVISKGTGYALDVKSKPSFINDDHMYHPYSIDIKEVDKFLLIRGSLKGSYNKETRCWENQPKTKLQSQPKPNIPSLPISGYCSNSSIDIDVDMTNGLVPTKDCDLALLHMAGHGNKHLWIGAGQSNDPENFKWMEVTPPPSWAFKYRDMIVHAIPVSVLKYFEQYCKLPKEEEEKKLYLNSGKRIKDAKGLTEPAFNQSDDDDDEDEYANEYNDFDEDDDDDFDDYYNDYDLWHHDSDEFGYGSDFGF